MKAGELKEYLKDINDDAEILLFPEMEGTDEDGNEVESGPGIGTFENDQLVFIGEVEQIELCLSKEDE